MTRDASPGCKRRPVRAGFAERVPDIRGGEQAGGRVQLTGAHTGRVPRPVDTLVVTAHDRAERLQHRRPGEDASRVVGVQAHQLPLLGPQRAGPLPDAGGDRDPAEVMHQPGPVHQCGIDPERAARRRGSGQHARRPAECP